MDTVEKIKEEYEILKKKYEDIEKRYMELEKLYSGSNRRFDDMAFIMKKLTGVDIPNENLMSAYTQLHE